MSSVESGSTSTMGALNGLLAAAGMQPLDSAIAAKLDAYLKLILRWNARTNLTSVRDVNGILSRHFVESIVCARVLPPGISLLDFGSGAGFPGIPIAICCPEIDVTLAESQSKKAAFLQEVVRTLELRARVFSGRAEVLDLRFDCVTLRAVDRMERAVSAGAQLVQPGGLLAIMTTTNEFPRIESALRREFKWQEPIFLPGSDQRELRLGRKLANS